MGSLHLKDGALSSSGSTGRYWGFNGKTHGHLLNPKTGMPMAEARTTTVVAPTVKVAEVLTKPLILGGLLTTWVFQFQRIGFSYERIVAYYLGGEINGQISFVKNFNVLLEEAHFHSFMMSVIFLSLSHLFIATSLPRGVKLLVILLSFFSQTFDMGAVWLVRYASPQYAYVLMVSWIGLWVGFLAMILVPVYEMWLRPPRP